MKWIDLPPVWTVLFIVVVWWVARLQPDMLALPLHGLGLFLICIAVLVMVAAAVEMWRHQTTVIPHQEADHLVTTGVFRYSRNPIYLADAVVIVGFCLIQGALVAVLLLPLFVAVITRRFIQKEEAGLRRKFPDAFADYVKMTRRWF